MYKTISYMISNVNIAAFIGWAINSHYHLIPYDSYIDISIMVVGVLAMSYSPSVKTWRKKSIERMVFLLACSIYIAVLFLIKAVLLVIVI